ncbi:hypothetical protein V0U79_08225 [Hyphobacterium sp. HN65]|uniref:DUF4345 domain-containing protein n=1 Tax=Hyphobacterium lacteum TaxID=3116575 RepID=A0ABU7LR31_9PROT|nr:hypothetical protein [Hyphobacterium sp. HN65]MEE2526350.1 hypothetical protein [Hyphobacterium sp. HN65]
MSDSENPKPKRNKVEGHSFWQPFQPITTYEQALAKTRTGVVVGILLIIQGVILAIAAMAGFAELFGLDRFVDDLERYSMVGVSIFLAVIGLVLALLLHRYQWWWVVVLLAVIGVFDMLSRIAGVFMGGANVAAIFFAIMEFVGIVSMVRGRIKLKRLEAARVDTAVFD